MQVEDIMNAAQRIRATEINLCKKYGFELKFTYWDGDDFLLKMKLENTRSLTIVRKEGDIVVTADSKYKCRGKLTIRPDQLIELFVVGKEAVNKMSLVQDVVADVGDITLVGLTVPGLSEMQKWCRSMDTEIVTVAKDLRKKKVDNIFKKIYVEIGGEVLKNDRVAKRVSYFGNLTAAFKLDPLKWGEDMKRVGLIK